MFSSICDAAWRVVVLLGLALAPYAAPVDAAPSSSPALAAIHLGVFVVVVAAMGFVVKRSVADARSLAGAVIATLVAACVGSVVFDEDRGPLARGVAVVAPFAWLSVALFLAGPALRFFVHGQRVEKRTRNAAAIAALGVAALSFVFARGRLGSTAQLWTEAFAVDHGNESAALAVASSLRASGDPRGAYEAERSCAQVRPSACRCEEAGDADGIDLGRYEEARRSLEAASACPRTPRRVGLTAEALIGTNAIDEGLHQAEIAIAANPSEPHAVYARAWGTMLKGYPADAKTFATRAVALERGLPAHLLLGLISYQLGDLDGASIEFRAALKDDPNNVQANYDQALIAQQHSRYREAREGYLKTLRLDPAYADAQYNLVVLTFNAGAVDEAQHRLEEMTRQCPNDRRLADLRAMIARGKPL